MNPVKRPQGSDPSSLKPPSSKPPPLEPPTVSYAAVPSGPTLPREPVFSGEKAKERKKRSVKRRSDAHEDEGSPERKRRAVTVTPPSATAPAPSAQATEKPAVTRKSSQNPASSRPKSTRTAASPKRAVAASVAPRSPQRKVKFKTKELKTSSPRRKKHHRSSSSGSGLRNSLSLGGDKMVVYETEVDVVGASSAMDLDGDDGLGSYLPPASPAQSYSALEPGKPLDTQKDTAMDVEVPPQGQEQRRRQSILPTEFVLPPPTPGTSVVLGLGLGLPKSTAAPPPQLPSLPSQAGHNLTQLSRTGPAQPQPPVPQPSPSKPLAQPSQSSPLKPHAACAFPFSKKVVNIAHRHQYSPVRPSPLSRILLLGDSPEVGLGFGTGLERMDEEAEEMFPEIDSTGKGQGKDEKSVLPLPAAAAPVAGPSKTGSRSATTMTTRAKAQSSTVASQAEPTDRVTTRSRKATSSSTAGSSAPVAAAAPHAGASSKPKPKAQPSKPSMGLPSRTRTRSPVKSSLGGVLNRSPGKARSGKTGSAAATAKGRVLFPS